jgi:hypothetical protein
VLTTFIDHNLALFPGLNFEQEYNTELIRVGKYLKSNLKYIRRIVLEQENYHLIIVDIKGAHLLRIINI